MKRGRIFTIFGVIFGLVGVVMLGVGIALAVSTARFQASADRTEGTVVALTERSSMSRSSGRSYAWHPTVEFTVDGRRYSFESSTGTNPPAYAEGDTVPVAYAPADPSDAEIASLWSAYFAPMISGMLGIVFTPIGVVALVMGRRSRQQHMWLLRKGREVWAEVSHVGVDPRVEINGRHPYVVHATWRDERTGRTHTATSDHVRDDPGPGLLGRTHVRVLYDPADPDRSVVDLDSTR